MDYVMGVIFSTVILTVGGWFLGLPLWESLICGAIISLLGLVLDSDGSGPDLTPVRKNSTGYGPASTPHYHDIQAGAYIDGVFYFGYEP